MWNSQFDLHKLYVIWKLMKTAFKIKYFQLNITEYNILYYSKCVEVEILQI